MGRAGCSGEGGVAFGKGTSAATDGAVATDAAGGDAWPFTGTVACSKSARKPPEDGSLFPFNIPPPEPLLFADPIFAYDDFMDAKPFVGPAEDFPFSIPPPEPPGPAPPTLVGGATPAAPWPFAIPPFPKPCDGDDLPSSAAGLPFTIPPPPPKGVKLPLA